MIETKRGEVHCYDPSKLYSADWPKNLPQTGDVSERRAWIQAQCRNEGFYETWARLEMLLDADPEDEVLRSALQDHLVPSYEGLMKSEDFRGAAGRAEALVRAGIDTARPLLEDALKRRYLRAVDSGALVDAESTARALAYYEFSGGVAEYAAAHARLVEANPWMKKAP